MDREHRRARAPEAGLSLVRAFEEACRDLADVRPAAAVAFLDVDGTLLAETTTFLFARILHRAG